ncbi:DUF1801 domain-containing protein [Reyranella sp.]|jgi:hypothetical protein|uniref:DUF1801 domain-containing protein n=1 Tax=Reyranella sp. TaxID=1929291 RepID=UPI000BDD9ED3|nr:DUF1801 domain-containing protein [Reyranella sp.]OYY42695.1 MAG: hypothetical protein B7Y57_11090 [Rhodospirillales bacterium 35-66-84]OYZ94358.1 MAG: hypothetical protein B7Y08_12635 [Rhodospirillales bacterium 24-66-33]OZB25280.1 MAG: hypothetical protein B7X63_12485 [Rhodospirillales bacterium 39-66-50]HQS16534.1 DUF1801 domain-containing protein [Reyranella sp.]HQT13366.1 DUF1801 domain-containing protein [Reyranella sp.]
MKRFDDPRVAATFKAYPPEVRARLMALRETIVDVAATTDGVGVLTETLKWGQPSYLTEETGSGTTVRIDRLKGDSGGYAVYFHCQSGLIGQFRELYPETFAYEGERAILFDLGTQAPARELRHCIALALTHHLRKKRKREGVIVSPAS